MGKQVGRVRRSVVWLAVFGAITALAGLGDGAAGAADTRADRLGYDFVVTDDGTYIWYNDERAIVKDGTLMAGFVTVDGTTSMATVDLATGRRLGGSIPLKYWRGTGDDHTNPAMLAMNNGRIGVFYTGHDWSDGAQFARISNVGIPTSIRDFGPERPDKTVVNGAAKRVTYNNVFQLSAENDRIYNFFRIDLEDLYYFTYDGNGNLENPEPRPLILRPRFGRPDDWMYRVYGKYASNGVDRIDMFLTDGHPIRSGITLYHAYYQGGSLYASDGSLIGNMADAPFNFDKFTKVYQYNADDGYNPWNYEIKLAADGQPVVVFDRHYYGEKFSYTRLDYQYAKYDPVAKQWVRTPVADAGSSILPATFQDPVTGDPRAQVQPHYAGGVALNPLNTNEVFISTDVNPITSAPTDKHEIYRGRLVDGAFTWTALTQNSQQDNYRPFVPTGATPDDQVVIWFTGKYDSFVNGIDRRTDPPHFDVYYDTRIVGRYLNRTFPQTGDDYQIDVNGDNAVTADGYAPLEGSGRSSLVTQRASVTVTNAKASRERRAVADPVLTDFGFADEQLDVSISDLEPGVYEFGVANYDTWNPQDVAIDFFATGATPQEVVASHAQTNPDPAHFYAQVLPDTDYTLRIRRLGTRPVVLNGLTITRVGDVGTPVARFDPTTDITVKVGTKMVFDGSGSFNPDGGELQYAWRSTGIPKVASQEAKFERTFDTVGRVGVQLSVSNSANGWSKQHINVFVVDR